MIDLEKLRELAEDDVKRGREWSTNSRDVLMLLDYIAQLEKDAGRYRWLRKWKGQEHEPPFTVQHEVDGTVWGGDLDHAIDTAMESKHG